MIIRVDVDGVLRDIITPTLKIYRQFYNESKIIKPGHIKEFNLNRYLPEVNNWENFFVAFGNEIFLKGLPYPGATSFMKKLNKHFDIAIVSHQFRGVEMYTTSWLQYYQIPYNHIVFTKDKEIINSDILIDDAIHNLEKAKIPICIKRPWNQDWTGKRYTLRQAVSALINNDIIERVS